MKWKQEILEKVAFIKDHNGFASLGIRKQEVSFNPCLTEKEILSFE